MTVRKVVRKTAAKQINHPIQHVTVTTGPQGPPPRMTVSLTPPPNPKPGDVWFQPDE